MYITFYDQFTYEPKGFMISSEITFLSVKGNKAEFCVTAGGTTISKPFKTYEEAYKLMQAIADTIMGPHISTVIPEHFI